MSLGHADEFVKLAKMHQGRSWFRQQPARESKFVGLLQMQSYSISRYQAEPKVGPDSQEVNIEGHDLGGA